MAKYAGKTSTDPIAYVADPTFTLYCSCCGSVVKDGDMVLDREIWKCGELDCIEIFHASCGTVEPGVETAVAITLRRIEEDREERRQRDLRAIFDQIFADNPDLVALRMARMREATGAMSAAVSNHADTFEAGFNQAEIEADLR